MKNLMRETLQNFRYLIKWILISALCGSLVGIVAAVFAALVTFVTGVRTDHPWLIYLLPPAGMLIIFLYRITGGDETKGTNQVIRAIHRREHVPYKIAPLIFISSVISHLFGASVGREGAALQLGGSMGCFLGEKLKLDENDRIIVIVSSMGAAFAAIFGTPVAAAFFAMEVESVGIMHYSALIPCVCASFAASRIALAFGVTPEHFGDVVVPDISLLSILLIVLIAIIAALVSTFFCELLGHTEDFLEHLFPSMYPTVFLAGTAVVLVSVLMGSTDYLGGGLPVIERALHGDAVWYAFIMKMIFTAICIGAGYKGGEIVPSLFIGATLGCTLGKLFGLSPSLAAACGMASLFVGVTNCPVSTLLLITELFGFEGILYYVISIAVSYIMSGYHGLYKTQRIVWSKHRVGPAESAASFQDQKTLYP
ncbi:MAG: chloride channel protein [Lachnospiraceae bacterium]|nr:chloride channel protein [Lachnospiraceae bacterium]